VAAAGASKNLSSLNRLKISKLRSLLTRTLVSTSPTKTRRSKLSALADIPVNRICGAGMVKTSGLALAERNQDFANSLRIGAGCDGEGDDHPARPVIAHKMVTTQ